MKYFNKAEIVAFMLRIGMFFGLFAATFAVFDWAFDLSTQGIVGVALIFYVFGDIIGPHITAVTEEIKKEMSK